MCWDRSSALSWIYAKDGVVTLSLPDAVEEAGGSGVSGVSGKQVTQN